jgi:high affinity Mn2+ porin
MLTGNEIRYHQAGLRDRGQSRYCHEGDGSKASSGYGVGMRALWIAGLGLVLLAGGARAADLSAALPTKAPPPVAPAAYDWTGFYVGGHAGYAFGSSQWTSTQAGMPSVAGSFDFTNGYNFSGGTGSYFLGFQAGYDYLTASHWLFGVETDIAFPSFVGGTNTVSTLPTGTVSELERVEFSGNVLGRVGYAPSFAAAHWLFYATGGFAWTYDQFTRTQLAGTPAGGTAVPGVVENAFLVPRVGGAVGAGVEVALASHWTAQLQYLFTDYGNSSVTFPAVAQRLTSDLMLQQLRFGLNYRFNSDSSASADKDVTPPALQTDNFAVHAQTTYLQQYAPTYRSPYLGPNSLIPNQSRETWDATAFLGVRLWDGAEFWLNPEIDQGFGLSGTLGVAGFPSGEAYKVGQSAPYARVPRAFIRQTIDLGGDEEKVEAAANQFSGSETANRLVITVGKFSVTDVFDTNRYAHDPRSDFMNWTVVDTGTFDYAADAWGFTYGAAAEWYQGDWTVRGGVFDLSVVPNSTDLDTGFTEFQSVGEIERRYQLWGQPGKIAVTGYLTRGRMGSIADAIALANATGLPADITAVRQYRSSGGISMNLEQQITETLGVFARAGWRSGNFEPYEFTDVDRTVVAGLQLAGKQWGRPDDTFGIAGVVNGISNVHQQFLNDGGLGILVGDGQLPNPGSEKIIETYYQLPVSYFKLSVDYQFIANPGYNRDRGPVSVIGARLHSQF